MDTTKTEYAIKTDYGYGWEISTYCDSKEDALRAVEEYRENMPEYPHRITQITN